MKIKSIEEYHEALIKLTIAGTDTKRESVVIDKVKARECFEKEIAPAYAYYECVQGNC